MLPGSCIWPLLIIQAMYMNSTHFLLSCLKGTLFAVLLGATFCCKTAAGQNNPQSDLTNQSGSLLVEPSSSKQFAKEQGTLIQPDLAVPFYGNYPDVRHIVQQSGNRTGECWNDVDPALWTLMPSTDDGSLGPINLPFTFDLYGTSYTSLYINNNGNITFNSPLSWYSATGFPISTPMIAPFWGDVDTRNGHGEVWYYIDAHAFYVTWLEVGPYNAYNTYSTGLQNTFQVVITDGTDPVVQDGNNIGFFYGEMGWTAGSASGGTAG